MTTINLVEHQEIGKLTTDEGAAMARLPEGVETDTEQPLPGHDAIAEVIESEIEEREWDALVGTPICQCLLA